MSVAWRVNIKWNLIRINLCRYLILGDWELIAIHYSLFKLKWHKVIPCIITSNTGCLWFSVGYRNVPNRQPTACFLGRQLPKTGISPIRYVLPIQQAIDCQPSCPPFTISAVNIMDAPPFYNALYRINFGLLNVTWIVAVGINSVVHVLKREQPLSYSLSNEVWKQWWPLHSNC